MFPSSAHGLSSNGVSMRVTWLRARGMRPEEIEALRVENPTVVLDGASTPLLDLLENRGAAETAAILGKLGLADGTADAAR